MTGTTIEAEEFKMTEIGPLPIEWGVAKFGELVAEITTGDWGETNPGNDLQKCSVLRGTDFSRVFKGSFANIPIRYLRPSSLQKRRLCKGDILIELSGGSKDQPTGRVVMVTAELIGRSTLPLVFSNFVKRLSVKTSLLPEFCWHYWEFLYQSGVTRTYEKRTTGIRNFKLNDFLASEYIPLPPLPEQKKIAYVLSTVQNVVEKTEVVIKAARALKKSLMKHLFTYGPVSLEEAENVTLRETEIGLVPEDWEVVRLEEVCELRKEAVEPTNKGLRYIGLEHMDSGKTRINRFGSEDEVRSTKNRFYEGDILYGKLRPYLDKVAITNFDGICSTDIMVITMSSNRVSAHYFVNLLHLASFLSFAISTMTGVNHPRTSWKALTPFMIPLPSIVTQKRIAEALFTIDQKIEAGENQKRALEALFKTLLSNLMTGKIRVNNLEVPV